MGAVELCDEKLPWQQQWGGGLVTQALVSRMHRALGSSEDYLRKVFVRLKSVQVLLAFNYTVARRTQIGSHNLIRI